jgi:hypothetical protein
MMGHQSDAQPKLFYHSFNLDPDFDGLDLRTQRYQLVKKYWGTTEG